MQLTNAKNIINVKCDYGTPAVESKKEVSLTIDGQTITAFEGESVMRAALKVGINIPRLCATDSLKPIGGCRLCIVEIEGARITTSCTAIVAEGLVVTTESKEIFKLRKNLLDLYISEHPLECLVCSANGDCDLQALCAQHGVRGSRFLVEKRKPHKPVIDKSAPYFDYESTKCISCYKCVRVCIETQGTFALTVKHRGLHSEVCSGLFDFKNSICVSCGKCVEVCPTASLNEKSMIKMGLPSKQVATTCAYCGVGCGLVVETKMDEVVRITPNANTPSNKNHLCVKGRFAYSYVSHKERITEPLIRESINEPWKKVSFDEAFAFIAKGFNKIKEKYGNDALGSLASSRCTIEEIYTLQKFNRTAFLNNNIDNCARRCHSPTGYGLDQTLGTSSGTQNFDSIEHVDVFLIVGANPTNAHPVVGARLKKRMRVNSVKTVVIDPMETELVSSPLIKADVHLQIKPGTNVAVLNSIAHVLVTQNLVNKKYIKEQLDNTLVKKYMDFIKQDQHSPEHVAKIAGVSSYEIVKAANIYGSSDRSSIFYGLGVTEHAQGSDGVMTLANLAMLTGNLGRNGSGINPLRGQNNVQGACDVGAYPHSTLGYEDVTSQKVADKYSKAWGIEQSTKVGQKMPDMIDSALQGKFKGFFIQGEEIMQSEPDLPRIAKALSKMDLVVQLDLFLNETSAFAHVFLPGSSFLEKNGVFINAERRLSRVRNALKPKVELQEWEIISKIATAMGYDMHYNHPEEILDEMKGLWSDISEVSYDKIDELGGVQWPCNKANPNGSPILHEDKIIREGGGALKICDYQETTSAADVDFPLTLITGRVLVHYNVGTQTRRTKNSDWHDKDELLIHPSDAQPLALKTGDLVRLTSRTNAISIAVKLSKKVKEGTLFTTFHHPDTAINAIQGWDKDKATKCPEFKVTAVKISATDTLSEWQISRNEQVEKQKYFFEASVEELTE
ncbi:MAG: formate dehydrogenase subunit alpha [Psychromonas sp.]